MGDIQAPELHWLGMLGFGPKLWISLRMRDSLNMFEPFGHPYAPFMSPAIFFGFPCRFEVESFQALDQARWPFSEKQMAGRSKVKRMSLRALTWSEGISCSNKKLLVTSALLVVTKSY